MTILDDETLQMYVEESLDHLADIENDLLAMEDAGADVDTELVNKVFRAAHSIKGGAGFLGLQKISELAHKLENVLGMVRSGEIVPNPDIVNVLLQGFDRLRELVGDVDASNDADVSELVVALTGLTTALVPEERKETVSQDVDIHLGNRGPVFTVSRFELDEARKGGKFLYVFEYDLINDVHRGGRTPLEVLAELDDGGQIVDCTLDLGAVGTLDGEVSTRIPFLVLFTTIIDRDIISGVYGLPDEQIHRIATEAVRDAAPRSVVVEPPHQQMTAEPAAPKPVGQPAPEAVSPEPAPKTESPKSPAGGAPKPKKAATKVEASLRVHVGLLDTLMTLAGELVLSRNQLVQALDGGPRRAMETVAQRIDLITSELQEAIMLTRMQPVGNIFNKFPRVVRDLSRKLDKQVDLELEGTEVELDKTIIEGLNDPLTHLVRNSVDHGVELPAVREAAGKPARGKVQLRAYHEAGQVIIEIIDDGKGLDAEKLASVAINKGLLTADQAQAMSAKEKTALIFMAGFSTAEKVTDVSGRGVGMDVVKTNLDKLGGVVELESEVGVGTSLRIKLPLTLAIIPAQMVGSGGQAFAIPQVNMNELLRIPAAKVLERIERVGDAEVVRLRDRLLPLVRLADVLEKVPTFRDPETGALKPDRRRMVADRRARTSPLFREGEAPEQGDAGPYDALRSGEERRQSATSAVNVVVATTGAFQYGLVVDELLDAEEIVVKPLGRHLKQCDSYAGATIMGSGRVALILDIPGVARAACLSSLDGCDRAAEVARETRAQTTHTEDLLLFHCAADEQFAVHLDLVVRIERIHSSDIEVVVGQKVLQYQGGSLPLLSVDDVAHVGALAETAEQVVLVMSVPGRTVGLLVSGPVDAFQGEINIDKSTLAQFGIAGSTIIEGQTTLLVDVVDLARRQHPEWFEGRGLAADAMVGNATVVLAEDSAFFRDQVAGFIRDSGYEVIDFPDGAQAWAYLQASGDKVDAVVTDIEMPHMDGLELTRRIKADDALKCLPVIAVTTLADDEDIARGKGAGVDDYQIKLDRESLLKSLWECLGSQTAA